MKYFSNLYEFLKKYYKIFLIIGIAVIIFYILYYVELYCYIGLKFATQIIFDESYYFPLIVIYVSIHYIIIKLIILIALFPSGFTITKSTTFVQIYEEHICDLIYVIKLIKANIRSYSDNKKGKLLKFEVNKLMAFQRVLQIDHKQYEYLKLNEYKIEQSINEFLDLWDILNKSTQQDIKIIEEILVKINFLEDQMQKYIDNYSFYKMTLNWRKIMNYFKYKLEDNFKNKIEEIQINDNFNIKIIHSEILETQYKNSIVVICNPNGISTEIYAVYRDLLDLYLIKGISVLIWDYKGSGERSGLPSFNNIKQEGEDIINYLLKSKNFTKIGVHGYSIGGIVACHLASKFDEISLLIADRTFSALDDVIHCFPFGKYLRLIFKLFFPFSLEYSNIDNYIKSKKSKLILFDRNDEIIPSKSSLKKEAAYKIFNDYFKQKVFKIQKVDTDGVKFKLNIVNLLFTSTEIEMIKTSLFNIMRFYMSFMKPKENETVNPSLKFIEDFFENFLFYESSLTLQNFDENIEEFLEQFLVNTIVWGFNSKNSNTIYFEKYNDTIILHDNYNVIFSLVHSFNSNFETLTDINFDEELKLHFKNFATTFLSKINTIMYKIHYCSESEIEDEIKFNFHKTEEILKLKIKDEIKKEIHEKIGNYLYLTCGHNGRYSENEEKSLHEFLKLNKMY